MATLQQVHFKIRELGEDWGYVSIDAVLKAFNNVDIIIHIQMLSTLELIEVDYNNKIIRLTLHGRLTNIP